MNRRWVKLGIGVVLWVVIAVAGFGSAVWQLWNLVMPDLFGLHSIGFWQAVGLLALSWLLFGGWRWPGHAHGRRGHFAYFDAMSDGERQAFRAVVRQRSGRSTESAASHRTDM